MLQPHVTIPDTRVSQSCQEKISKEIQPKPQAENPASRGTIESAQGGHETRPYTHSYGTSTATINASPDNCRARAQTCPVLRQALNPPIPQCQFKTRIPARLRRCGKFASRSSPTQRRYFRTFLTCLDPIVPRRIKNMYGQTVHPGPHNAGGSSS